jgi:hypothetical protein
MTNIGVDDATGAAAGWNVTVIGDTAAGKSPVFKQYCLGPAVCGADAASSYVPTGASLPAGSLNVNSTSGGFTASAGTTGTAPTHQCDSGVCPIDAASATKVISAAVGAGMGTYVTNAFSPTSLPLTTPSTLKALPTRRWADRGVAGDPPAVAVPSGSPRPRKSTVPLDPLERLPGGYLERRVELLIVSRGRDAPSAVRRRRRAPRCDQYPADLARRRRTVHQAALGGHEVGDRVGVDKCVQPARHGPRLDEDVAGERQ